MAGKNQHFLPRFLQDGFRASTKGRKAFLHHKTRGVRLTSIGEIGSENYFYSRPSLVGEVTLDDLITKEENTLTRHLDWLRSLPIGEIIEAGLASEIVAHFSVRTRNFRELVGSAGELAMQGMAGAISDAPNLARLLGLDRPEPNDLWRSFVERSGEWQNVLEFLHREQEVPKALTERLCYMLARELLFTGHTAQIESVLGSIETMRSTLRHILPELHNNALAETRKPQRRLDHLAALEWKIFAGPYEGSILPDCVALGRTTESQHLVPYAIASGDELDLVIMPIASDKLLIGLRSGAKPPIIKDFNLAAARNSAEFFVSGKKTAETEALIKQIGNAWSAKINELIDDSISEFKPVPKEVPNLAIAQSVFEQHFDQTADNEAFEAMKRTIIHYHNRCPITFNLERLDRIEILDAAGSPLSSIAFNLRSESSSELTLQEVIEGFGLLNVNSDNNEKVAIILEIEAFQGFTSTDPLKRRIAHSGLIACLSTISALARIEAHLPGFSRRALSFADYDSVVHCAIQSPILAYWAGRDAAIAACAETLIEAANRELSHRLTCLVDGINDAKAKLLETNDRTEFFTTIVMEVSKFLDFVARLIGLIHGCDQADKMVNSATLLETLQPFELKPWISVFGQDLRSIWEIKELTPLDLYTMNIHVERFLLSFGVILWRDETTGHPNIGSTPS